MSYRLRDGLSFCWIDGHAIFLDIRNDRYFRLSHSMEAIFSAFIDGRNSETDSAALARSNILTTEPKIEGNDGVLPPAPPTRSILEQPGLPVSVSVPILLEISALVLATRRALKARALADVMDRFILYRQKSAQAPAAQPETAHIDQIFAAAKSFNRARLYVPVKTSCLLDSLSMAKFLSRRRIFPNIVFGVTRDPFAAHCWVQVGDLVLNDTVGNVTSHTAIRIV